jgi:DNA-directed RNA polymerase specialized sigma24 family protein
MNTAAAAHPVAFVPSVSWTEMVAHRGYLVRFAQRKLRDPLLAEDAVHDVFEAVLSGRAVFGGRCALRSWLTAVLKHKIVDSVRRNAGTDSLDDAFGHDGDESGACDIECPQPRPDSTASNTSCTASSASNGSRSRRLAKRTRSPRCETISAHETLALKVGWEAVAAMAVFMASVLIRG